MIVFIVSVVFTLYAVGANAIEGFVNYPSWRLIPQDAFPGFHQRLSRLVPPWVVLPTLVATLSTAALVFWGPVEIPAWMPIAAALLQLVGWVTSIAVDIPIQMRLDKAHSQSEVDRLILTDRWLRQLPFALSAALIVAMLYLLLQQVP